MYKGYPEEKALVINVYVVFNRHEKTFSLDPTH